MRKSLLAVCISVLFSVSCITTETGAQASFTPDEPIRVATSEVTEANPTLILEDSSMPKRIEFQSSDGTDLVGTFWPTSQPNSPGVLLMHWNPGTRGDWAMLAALLQGAGVAETAAANRGFAVFAFDFRGHGESGGTPSQEGYIHDAKAALALFQSLPSVDSNRVVLIGASIGGDAAVDACGTGCIGAISLSPGDYLGVKYADALRAIENRPVLCVAAQGDHPSPETCESGQDIGLPDYQVQYYQGSAHGMALFDITEEEPALVDLIFEWLNAHVSN